ncbi:MAG: hypothetical protein GY909_18535 [Oligoflexia bacterium]|nr:hypothetical protein [Oligoflexia bacterium]
MKILLLLAISILSVLITSHLSILLKKKLNFEDKVLASALTPLIILPVAYLLRNYADFNQLLALSYGASFVGMTSSLRLPNKYLILSSILLVGIFQFSLSFNLGGELGFMAFLSVGTTYLLMLIFSRIQNRTSI